MRQRGSVDRCGEEEPESEVIGIDRWGKEYASFSRPLCEKNAKAEGVSNVSFQQGDATHLDFADETFDVVTSNYVYHNIPGEMRPVQPIINVTASAAIVPPRNPQTMPFGIQFL